MTRQWHIDGAEALIVDGTRFELQQIQLRSEPSEPLYTYTFWTKSTNQSGPGLVIDKPIYLPNAGWWRYDSEGRLIFSMGTVFKERTWNHYGSAGYTPGATQYQITTLSPYSTDEYSGPALAFENLRLNPDDTNNPALYFGNKMALINSSFLVINSDVKYQVYGLGLGATYGRGIPVTSNIDPAYVFVDTGEIISVNSPPKTFIT